MKRYMTILFLLALGAISLQAQDTTTINQTPPDPGARIREESDCECHRHPVNDYPGLNSLKARLANPSWNGRLPTLSTGLKLEDGRIRPLKNPEEEMADPADIPYITEMRRGEVPVGAPVYVFFPLAGFRIRNPEQIIGIKAVADLALAQSFRIRITGAGDSATGSRDKNEALAKARADNVAELFKDRGVSEELIEIRSDGGIAAYEPAAANRHCKIELFFNLHEE